MDRWFEVMMIGMPPLRAVLLGEGRPWEPRLRFSGLLALVVAWSLSASAQVVPILDVPATATIYGAGRAVMPEPAGNGAGKPPVEIPLPPGSGRSVRFDNLTGTLDLGACCAANGPDGAAGAGVAAALDWDGIAGQSIARDGFLSAVFLDDQTPADPPPPQLVIGSIGFTALSPDLGQTFFVGDGRVGTGSGALQVFEVPDGATRLFLGLHDSGAPDPSVPGLYNDNAGSVSGTLLISSEVGDVVQEQKISDLSGSFGGVLANSDQLGLGAARIGDVDGDGVVDAVLGARNDDDGGPNRGAVWVLLLNADGTVKAESKISALSGGGPALADGDLFGFAVAGIGDIDFDGVPDIAVGAIADDTPLSNNGALYLIALNPTGTAKSVTKVDGSTPALAGALDAADSFGSAVASVGDIDGDGLPELAVGAPGDDDGSSAAGAIYLLTYDPITSAVGLLRKLSASTHADLASLGTSHAFGTGIAAPGDIDDDGVPDLVVGAPQDGAGMVYVLRLESDGDALGIVQVGSGLNGGPTLDANADFGFDLSAIGDADGNGIEDVLVGAPRTGAGGTARGAVYFLFLKSDGSALGSLELSGQTDVVGPFDDFDFFGGGVAGLGDLNGDGVGDLLVGAHLDDDGGSSRGAAYALALGGVELVCGDGSLDPGEQCDDGNTTPGDGCSATCQIETFDLQLESMGVFLSHPGAYVVGTDLVVLQVSLEASIEQSASPEDFEAGFELVAYSGGVACDGGMPPAACTAAGASAVFELATELVPALHLDTRPALAGAPAGPFVAGFTLSNAVNQGGAGETFEAWREAHLLEGNDYRVRVILDPDDAIAETPIAFAEDNNEDLFASAFYSTPLTGRLAFGPIDTQILGVSSQPGGGCALGQLSTTSIEYEWAPSTNGNWAPVVEASMTPSPSCNALATPAVGPGLDLIATFSSTIVSHAGTLGGVDVELAGTTLGPGGAMPGSATFTLAPRHSVHEIGPTTGLPVPRGRRRLEFSPPALPVTDFGTLSYGIGPGYLQASGLPVALAFSSLRLEEPIAYGPIVDVQYVHDLPFAAADPRHTSISGVRSNDRRYDRWDTSSGPVTMTLDASGADVQLQFLGQAAAQPRAKTHYPRTQMRWDPFGLVIDDGRVVPGATLPAGDSYRFRPIAACVDCPADSEPGPRFTMLPDQPQGISEDGAVMATIDRIGADATEYPVWGPYDNANARFVFEREDDWDEPGVFSLPGFEIPGSGGEAGIGGAPASVSDSLLGMRAAQPVGTSIRPAALHRRGSGPARRGNHFAVAGLTMGPEFYSQGPNDLPLVGEGSTLAGTRVTVGLGGLPSADYEVIENNEGAKYVLRRGGLTGVFNTTVAPNPNIYGYDFELHRFAFRQVSNELDPNTWIDGRVTVPLPGEFEIVFESLDLLCTGDIGEGLVVSEACDAENNNTNPFTDENCDEVLGAWQADFQVLSMDFVPSIAGAGTCDPSDRVMDVGSIVDVVALEEELGLQSKWAADGAPFDSNVSGRTEQLVDDPGVEGEAGFLLLLGSKVQLRSLIDDSAGWFLFEDASVALPFWDALDVGARLQNASTTSQLQTVIGAVTDDIIQGMGAFADQDNAQVGTLMDGNTSLEVNYTWGATGFRITLPVFYEAGNFASQTARFLGKKESISLIVLDASAGTDFITPEKTKISFGASANFDELNFSSLPLNIDLTDPASMIQIDALLGGTFVQDIAGNLAGSVNSMNDVIGNNLDGFIEDGIFDAINEGRNLLPDDPFEELASSLGQINGVPGRLVEAVALNLEELKAGLLSPLSSTAEASLGTLLGDLPTLLDDAQNVAPDLAALEDALAQLDALAQTLAAVEDRIGDLSGEVDRVRDDLRGSGDDLVALIGGAKDAGLAARDGIRGVIDDAIGFNTCQVTNPVIGQIAEVGTRVRQVQAVLEAIDLDAIGGALSYLAEVDLSTITQAEQEIQNLAKDIADRIETAESTVNGLIGCGGGGLPYATFGDDLDQFLGSQLGTALETIDTDLEGVLDTLLGDPFLPTDTGLLGTIEDEVAARRGEIAGYRNALETLRGALEVAINDPAPTYEFTSGSPADIETWLQAELGSAGSNAITVLRSSLDTGLDGLIANTAFVATTGLGPDLQDLGLPTAFDIETVMTDRLMNDGLIQQADRLVATNMTALVDKTNGIQLLVFDQINAMIRSLIQQQNGVLADLLNNEISIVEGNGSEWNMPTAKMDGWGLIQGDDLQQLHVALNLGVPGQEDKDSFELDLSLDVTRWTANGKDQGCASVDAASRLDVVLAAYNLPFRLGQSEANLRKVFFGFTLDEAGGAPIPVQGFGGLAVDGALDFTVVQVIDPAFVFGGGDQEVYVGAAASAVFDGASISVAFLVGRMCNNEPLLAIDPQAAEFIDLSGSQGFTGGYVRGSASSVIYSNGCVLELGAGVDIGSWLFLGPPFVAGGIMGGGVFGTAACIVSIRGQLTMIVGIEDTLATFAGETFFVGGLGICKPSSWTTVAKSRNDDIFCGTVDARIGARATVDLDALFDGGGAGSIGFQVDPPDFGAIH